MSMTSLLARLGASASRSSTLEASRVSRAFNSLSRAQQGCLVRSYTAAVNGRLLTRDYATETARPGRPKTGKGTITKRAAGARTVTKTTVKKTVKKTATRKKAKAKAKKKPVKKKKVLTVEQKETRRLKAAREEIKELKLKALDPPKAKSTNVWSIYVAEHLRGTKTAGTPALGELAVRYKQLSPADIEALNHIATQNKAQNDREHDAWIKKHSAEEIRLANQTRKLLRRRLSAKASTSKSGTTRKSRRWSPIKDDRQVKGPLNTYAQFLTERTLSGDFKNIGVVDRSKLIGKEWTELNAGQKKKYEDLRDADYSRYVREYRSTYGHAPQKAAKDEALGAST